MPNLEDKVKKLETESKMTRKFSAIVEGIGNKDKPGQVQLRVAGVHPTSKKDLPTEKLPWQKVIKNVGSGAGMGESVNMVVGQWVEVEASNPGASSWKVIRNIAAVPSQDKGDKAYGQVAEGDDDKLEAEIEPRMSLGDASKLAGTSHDLVNSSLLESFTGAGGPPAGDPSPPIPVPIFLIDTPNYDWTLPEFIPEKEVSKEGKDIGNIRDLVTIDGHRPTDNTVFELLNEANGHPGNIEGYDINSNPIYIKLHNDAILVPRMILSDSMAPIVVTLRYKATEVATIDTPDIIPDNSSEGWIKFNVVFEPTVVIKVQQVYIQDTVDQSTKDVSLKEDPDTAEKTEPARSKVWQSPDGLITERKDYTTGNSSWGVTHLTEKGNAESGSRMHMGPKGIMTMKSSSDMVLISKKNLQMYIENEVEQTIKTMMTIHCPLTKIKGDVRIEGDLHIIGDITHTGTQTTSVDVIANSISLVNHTHSQGNDTDGNGQVETNKPS